VQIKSWYDVCVSGITATAFSGGFPRQFYGTPSETEGFDQCGAINRVGFLHQGSKQAVVLTGTNNYSGPTTIKDGLLLLSGQLLGGSPVTVPKWRHLAARHHHGR